jgi:hypothetical protein
MRPVTLRLASPFLPALRVSVADRVSAVVRAVLRIPAVGSESAAVNWSLKERRRNMLV